MDRQPFCIKRCTQDASSRARGEDTQFRNFLRSSGIQICFASIKFLPGSIFSISGLTTEVQGGQAKLPNEMAKWRKIGQDRTGRDIKQFFLAFSWITLQAILYHLDSPGSFLLGREGSLTKSPRPYHFHFLNLPVWLFGIFNLKLRVILFEV